MGLPSWVQAALPAVDMSKQASQMQALWRQYGGMYGGADDDWAIAKVTPNQHQDIKVQYSEFLSETVCAKSGTGGTAVVSSASVEDKDDDEEREEEKKVAKKEKKVAKKEQKVVKKEKESAEDKDGDEKD